MITRPNEFAFFPPVGRERFLRERIAILSGLRALVAVVIRGLLRLYLRFEISGAQNLPNDGSFVLVANHSSHLDALCLLAALPLRRLPHAYTVAAEDYFFQHAARFWIAALTANVLPVKRGKRVRESLAICSDVLATSGNILIIFPEGTRSRDGELQPFRLGIGALVAGRDLPVVPCHLHGVFRAWPKGRRLPRPAKVRLTIGAPRQYGSRSAAKNELATIATELQGAVRELGRTNGSR